MTISIAFFIIIIIAIAFLIFKVGELSDFDDKSINDKIELDIEIIPDPKGGGYTGYIKQLPNIVAEGKDREELVDNLTASLKGIVDLLANNSFDKYKSKI